MYILMMSLLYIHILYLPKDKIYLEFIYEYLFTMHIGSVNRAKLFELLIRHIRIRY